MTQQDIKNINSIRFTAIDMLMEAQEGWPDFVSQAAPIIYQLHKKHLKFNPDEPNWFNRDRFIYAADGSAALLYSTLHHFGYDISIDDLKGFCNIQGKTPLFPHVGQTPGIDLTTCPLGQETGQAVGFAIAEQILAQTFNVPNKKVIDNYTYILTLPEALQPGITYEAMSIAGCFKTSKLIMINLNYLLTIGDEHITAFSKDIEGFCKSIGFNYILVESSMDSKAFDNAIATAKKTDSPTFIDVKVIASEGTKHENTQDRFEEMYTEEDVEELRNYYQYFGEKFTIDEDVKKSCKEIVNKKQAEYDLWKKDYDATLAKNPEFQKAINHDYDIDLLKHFSAPKGEEVMLYSYFKHYYDKFPHLYDKSIKLFQKLGEILPTFVNTSWETFASGEFLGVDNDFSSRKKRNLIFGVREFAQTSIVNGMALYGGMKSVGFIWGPFLDYAYPSIKMAAIEKIPSLFYATYVNQWWENDDFFQLIEQMATLRSFPNLNVFHPCDVHESLLSHNYYLKQKTTPTIIMIHDQPVMTISDVEEKDFIKGGYVIQQETDTTNFKTIIASGPEVHLALKVAKERDDIRVVSMPSIKLFRAQSREYQNSIIPDRNKSIFLEISNDYGLYQFAKEVYGIRPNSYIDKTSTIKMKNQKDQIKEINSLLNSL